MVVPSRGLVRILLLVVLLLCRHVVRLRYGIVRTLLLQYRCTFGQGMVQQSWSTIFRRLVVPQLESVSCPFGVGSSLVFHCMF